MAEGCGGPVGVKRCFGAGWGQGPVEANAVFDFFCPAGDPPSRRPDSAGTPAAAGPIRNQRTPVRELPLVGVPRSKAPGADSRFRLPTPFPVRVRSRRAGPFQPFRSTPLASRVRPLRADLARSTMSR